MSLSETPSLAIREQTRELSGTPRLALWDHTSIALREQISIARSQETVPEGTMEPTGGEVLALREQTLSRAGGGALIDVAVV